MPCKTIDKLSDEAEFSVEIDETGLPLVEYVEYTAVENKKQKNKNTAPVYDTVTGAIQNEKGNLTLLFESAGNKGKNELPEKMMPPQSSFESGQAVSVGYDEQLKPEEEPAPADNDLFSHSDKRRSFHSQGIVYDVAEELYIRERTRMDIESLCHPPFRKVFDSETAVQLDRKADERTRRLFSEIRSELKKKKKKPEPPQKTLSTAKAVVLQLLFLLPVVNILSAIVLSFVPLADKSIRSYARGYIILSSVFLTAALIYFVFSYFNYPDSDAFFIRLMTLFG